MTNSVLGVRNIQLTNGTDAMTIDTSGRIQKHVIPAFKAFGNSSYDSYSGGDTLQYHTASGTGYFNRGGHYDTSTYTFTAPIAGLYHFRANALIQSEGAAGLQFRLNGGIVTRGYNHGRDFEVDALFDLDVGDEVKVTTESGTSYYLGGGYGAFYGYFIG